MGIAEMEDRRRSCQHVHGKAEEELQNLEWYHDNLTRHAAEALLLSNGSDGSYLLRKSNGKTALFSLSVRAKDSVKHFHVEYTGSSYKFGFNEFLNLNDLIMHFANQPLIGSETDMLQISDGQLLLGPGPDEEETPIINSLCDKIRVGTATLGFNLNPFEDSLIYRVSEGQAQNGAKVDLKEIPTGTLIVLKHPYPRKVEEPSIYESVRVHTAMQTGRTEFDLIPNAPSLGTKEGYLTKQGKIVKNWKTRWFTLHRNELKYYKDQTSTEPIRALDLTECSAVQFDYSQEKVNCFCLVFPMRTYYLYAKTGVEADEWIKILQWKLSQIRKQQRQRDATLRP